MAYNLYQFTFVNTQSELVNCYIEDLQNNNSLVIPLTGAGAYLRNLGGDNDKFDPLRATEAEVRFIKTSEANMHTFSSGPDGRFKLTIQVGGNTQFVGFLQQDDITQLLLPNGSTEVRLVASCGLGRLKNIKLNEGLFGEPSGNYTLAALIAFALEPTKVALNINIVNNLFELNHTTRDSGVINCAFNQTFVDSRTFRNGDGWEDCYTVLQKIAGMNYFITQAEGKWWVIRVDEMKRNYGFYYTTYDTAGVPLSGNSADFKLYALNKPDATPNLGTELLYEESEEGLIRPKKYIKLRYRYETIGDVVCNGRFEDGDLIADNGTYKTYTLNSWTAKRGLPESGSPDGTVFIRRNFDSLGYEKNRFAALTPQSGAVRKYIESCPIEVTQTAKLTLSFDYAHSADFASTGGYTFDIAQVRLEADDATYWTLDDDGKWYQSDASWSVNNRVLQETLELGDDQREFTAYSIEAAPLPRTGKLYIMLIAEFTTSYNVDRYFANLQLLYQPFINDSYRPVSYHYHKVSQTDTYLANVDEEVYLSDTEHKILKGSMMYLDTGVFYLTNTWFNWFPSGSGFTVLGAERWGKYQAYAVWNQHYNYYRKIRIVASGLKNSGVYASPVVTYYLHTEVDNKRYMALNLERDLYLAEVRGTLVEVFDTDDSYYLGGDWEFKHISE